MRNDWKDSSVPDWASFFNKEEYEEFIILVSKYMQSKNVKFTIDDGVVNAEENGAGFGKMGLDNIARTCRQIEMNEWEYRINYHFDALEKSRLFQQEIESKKDSFEYMRQFLAVRIYHADYAQQLEQVHFIKKSIAEDLIAVMVFDFPDSIQNIQPSDIEKWGQQEADLFELGIENVRKNNNLSLNAIVVNDFTLYTIDSEHFFAGNMYFELDMLKMIDPAKGALVAFPNRHCSLMYPIKDMSMVQVLNELFNIVYNMHNDGAGPISSSVYWYNQGKLTRIPYQIEEEELKVVPPEEFIRFMNSLS